MNNDLIVITSRGSVGPAIDGLSIISQGETGLYCTGGILILTPGTGCTVATKYIKLNDREDKDNADIRTSM